MKWRCTLVLRRRVPGTAGGALKGFGSDPHAVPFMLQGKPAPDFTLRATGQRAAGEPGAAQGPAGGHQLLGDAGAGPARWSTRCSSGARGSSAARRCSSASSSRTPRRTPGASCADGRELPAARGSELVDRRGLRGRGRAGDLLHRREWRHPGQARGPDRSAVAVELDQGAVRGSPHRAAAVTPPLAGRGGGSSPREIR